MSDPNRADPFDLSDFTATPAKKPPALVQKEAIRQVSEANNFPSRDPERTKPAKLAVQRRRRTGRNVQFNIKATPETIARFTSLADKHGLVFGELLDRALDALEKSG
jgi:hypothetical protein